MPLQEKGNIRDLGFISWEDPYAKYEDYDSDFFKNGVNNEELILEKNLISEEKLFEMKSKLLNVPFKKIKAEVFHLVKEKTTATRICSLHKTLKKDLAKLKAKRKFHY
jgi:hypothetical protein